MGLFKFRKETRSATVYTELFEGTPEDNATELVRNLHRYFDMYQVECLWFRYSTDTEILRATFVSELTSLLVGCGYNFRLIVDKDKPLEMYIYRCEQTVLQ